MNQKPNESRRVKLGGRFALIAVMAYAVTLPLMGDSCSGGGGGQSTQSYSQTHDFIGNEKSDEEMQRDAENQEFEARMRSNQRADALNESRHDGN